LKKKVIENSKHKILWDEDPCVMWSSKINKHEFRVFFLQNGIMFR
jgi:hypothetical protein